ncbi:hypothetical protein ASD36_10245 [Rhizobium sp. Root1334]|nr:hypothetical protein ASC96_06920 [Rhizobium sp. Root1204]KQY11060.1 hypothetical protein ASD36_10245 [Rhizobium sp. Root1334]
MSIYSNIYGFQVVKDRRIKVRIVQILNVFDSNVFQYLFKFILNFLLISLCFALYFTSNFREQ